MSAVSGGVYLEVLIGAQPQKFSLQPAAPCRIGRGEQNTIVLADFQVSRQHALVQADLGGGFTLIDLGSRNGTFLNHRRVTAPVTLKPGDCILIGSCELRFHGPCEGQPAQPAGAWATVTDFSQRLVSILVADIRDFTGWSRRLPEDRLSQLISAFTRECGAALTQQGAFAQKYIGDAVMAFWLHLKDPPPASELRGVLQAAASLFRVVGGLQAQFSLEAPVRIGAGINTGLACVGNLGSEAASDYTALSEAVNLCFRLEAATKEIGCDLLVGPKTYQLLGCPSLLTPHTASLKGYPEPKPVWAADQLALAAVLETLAQGAPGQSTEVMEAQP